MLHFGELTRRVGMVALMRAVAPATSLATNVVLARTLSRDVNGSIQKVLIVVQVATLVGAFGIQTSLYYFLPRLRDEEKRGFITQSLALLSSAGGLLAIATYWGAETLAVWMREPALTTALRAGAITILAALPAMAAEPLFITEKRAGLGVATAAFAGLLQVGLITLAVSSSLTNAFHYSEGLHDGRIVGVFWALAIANTVRVAAAVAFTASTRSWGRWRPLNTALLVQQLTYVLPVGLTSALDTISSWLDRTLVARFYTSAELAVYTYGAIEIPFIGIVTGAVAPVLLPHFSKLLAEGERSEVLAVWHRAVRKGGLVLFGLFFVFWWLAPEFLVFLYSERYRESTPFFRIYLTLLPLRIVAFMPMLFALGRTRWVLTGAFGEILFNLTVSLFLMLRTPLGISGAAWGTVIATVVQVVFYLKGIRDGLGVTWTELLPWRPLARDFLFAGVCTSPLAIVHVAAFPSTVALALGGGIFSAYLWLVVFPRLRAQE